MHSPALRTARSLYHEWRLLPALEQERLAPMAREVKELALDLRGAMDSQRAEAQLAAANHALDLLLRSVYSKAA